MFKKILFLLLTVVLCFSITVPSVADSFTHVDIPGGSSEVRLTREMFYASKEINAAYFGLNEDFSGITDIYCDDYGNVYLLCGNESKLWYLDIKNKSAVSINVVDKDNAVQKFNGAQGVFCDKDSIIIADTSNARILILGKDGKVKEILNTPDSNLIPSDFLYQPTAVSIDAEGYLYVLSKGCYYGALMYSPSYEFMGFYGPNTVQSTALDTLSYLWNKLTSNNQKKASSVKKLPYSFTDFSFDSEGFMVTCTANVSGSIYGEKNIGQIKKISHNGSNILYKRNLNGDSSTSTSLDFLETDIPRGSGVQSIESLVVSDDDYIFALDSGHGYVYIYDSECNLMSTFGGGIKQGKTVGTFEKPVALDFSKDSLLVADLEKASITVFESTEYGNLIRTAQSLYISGDYLKSEKAWKKVLEMNSDCQLAYRGLAMAYYNQGKYSEALDSAKVAVNYSVYDLAWKEIVSSFIAKYFVVILILIVLIILLIIFLIRFFRKKGYSISNHPKFKLLLNVPFHPFSSFDDLRYKDMGSMTFAIVISVLFYVVSVLNVTSSGFLYSNVLLRNYNAIYTLFSSVGLVILWSVCNWLVCSMFEGKGNFKHVYISTCYALVPYIVFYILKIILSNFLPYSLVGLVTGLETAVLIFVFFLLSVAIMKVHEYDFFKFLLTSLVTVFMMILIVFVIFMTGILISQFFSFAVSIYEEIAHR